MNARSGFFLQRFLREFPYEPTDCQKRLLQELSDFLSADDGDILVVNGYAGTGKTTAVAAVVSALESLELRCVLLAPTGRSAKVLSLYAGRAASTIHKHIYRQKSMGNDGFGAFSLAPNKAKGSLFIVDEVSLIGIASDGSGGAFGSGNLLEDLVQFVRSGVDCKLVLIGDDAQLPPVGLDASPALSRAYMDGFGGVSYTALNTVVRQANDSGILRNATHLRSLLPLQDSPVCRPALTLRASEGLNSWMPFPTHTENTARTKSSSFAVPTKGRADTMPASAHRSCTGKKSWYGATS